MRNRHPLPMAILFLLSFSFLLFPSSALTHDIYIHSSTKPFITFTDFAFTNSGHIDLSLSPQNPNPNPNSTISFFLTPKPFKSPNCPLLPSNLTLSFPSPTTNTSLSFHITPPPGDFTFSFANCPPNLPISLELSCSMYNIDSHGRRNYLPAGVTPLPTVFFVSALVYFAVVISWILILRKNISIFHGFVFAALIVRAVMLLSEAEHHSFMNRTGRVFHDLDLIFFVNLFGAFSSGMFPHPVSMCRGPLNAGSLAPLFPMIVFFMGLNKKIKVNSLAAGTDVKVDSFLRRLRSSFVICCACVICYMYLFAGAVVCTLDMTTSYQHRWINSVAVEILNLAFYVFVGCKFDPTEKTIVTVVL